MRAAGDDAHGRRLRGLIVILWRAGLRIQEALALAEGDLDQRRGALLVRRGKGGRRREVGMDAWGWAELQPWLELRVQMPVGPLFCVINGRTRGRAWSSAAARAHLHKTAAHAGIRRRFAPHQLRHAHAVELAREGVPLIVIQRQFGHSNLGIRVPAGHRQRRDHRDHPCSPPADDPSQRLPAALKGNATPVLVAQSTSPVGVLLAPGSRRKGERSPSARDAAGLAGRLGGAYAYLSVGAASGRGCSSSQAGTFD
jgi:hypothetical protein